MTLPLVGFAASAALGVAADALGAAASRSPAGSEAKARKTADDFEAMFLEQSFERLVSGLGEDGPLGDNGTGGPVYRSMLVKEYAGSVVKSGGVGIAGSVYAELMKLQEGSGG